MESEVHGGRQLAAERVYSFFQTACQGMPLDLASLQAAAAKNLPA